jgi:hypothetical protein
MCRALPLAAVPQAVAAAPLAIATTAFADADNKYLGVGKAGVGAGAIDTYGAATTTAIGRPGAFVDAAGSAAPKGRARGAAASEGPPGSEKNAAQIAAMKRLMK